MSNDNNIKNLIYVYYVVIAMQGSTFETLKEKFTNILQNTSNYFKSYYLKPNLSKIFLCISFKIQ